MSRETPKSPHPDCVKVDEPMHQQVLSAVADDAAAPPYVRSATTPKPSGPPSEEDQVEADFDNKPV